MKQLGVNTALCNLQTDNLKNGGCQKRNLLMGDKKGYPERKCDFQGIDLSLSTNGAHLSFTCRSGLLRDSIFSPAKVKITKYYRSR